jgi:hypothetical protein
MDHIAHGKGRFITVLPGSRKEDAWFRGYLQDHNLPWEEVIRRPSPHGADRPDDLWRVVPAPVRDKFSNLQKPLARCNHLDTFGR